MYRPNTEPHADIDICSSHLEHIIRNENHHCVIMGDMNIDLLQFKSHRKTSDYLDNLFSRGFLPVYCKPTRVSIIWITYFHVASCQSIVSLLVSRLFGSPIFTWFPASLL